MEETPGKGRTFTAERVTALLQGFVSSLPDPAPVHRAFGGQPAFEATLKESAAADAARTVPTGEDAVIHTARAGPGEIIGFFNAVCMTGWLGGGAPALPVLAARILDSKGIDVRTLDQERGLSLDERKLSRALLLVAARAEMIRGLPPDDGARRRANDYHDAAHTAHVAVMAACLCDLNGDLHRLAGVQSLSRREQLMTILAAFAHDIDHPGRGNPPHNPYYNEENAFQVIKPLLQAAGVAREDVARSHVMMLATSPHGPLEYMKRAVKVFRAGGKPDAVALDPGGTMPDLAPLPDDPVLAQMAAILGDADLFASAGAGIEASREMSRRFTRESRRAGVQRDFTTDEEQLWFLENIVGADGFSSNAARMAFNHSFEVLLNARRAAVAAQRGEAEGTL